MDAVESNRTYAQTIKENLHDSWEKVKENPFVNFIFPVKDLSEGNTEALLPLVVPGGNQIAQTAKVVKPLIQKAFAVTISNGSGKAIKATYPIKGTPTFTVWDLNAQGKKRLLRTINDAEYQEALEAGLQNYASIFKEAQQHNINNSVLDLTVPTTANMQMETTQAVFQLPGVPRNVSAKELKLALKQAFNLKNEEQVYQLLKQNGAPEDYINMLKNNEHAVITVSDDILEVLRHPDKDIYDYVRSLFNHENAHAGSGGSKVINAVTIHNSQYPVKLNKNLEHSITDEIKQYYLNPDEIRARAMSIRRLHQTTGKSYEDLLREWELGLGNFRVNPNIDDLTKIYDRESIINYLDHFLESGGKMSKYY